MRQWLGLGHLVDWVMCLLYVLTLPSLRTHTSSEKKTARRGGKAERRSRARVGRSEAQWRRPRGGRRAKRRSTGRSCGDRMGWWAWYALVRQLGCYGSASMGATLQNKARHRLFSERGSAPAGMGTASAEPGAAADSTQPKTALAVGSSPKRRRALSTTESPPPPMPPPRELTRAVCLACPKPVQNRTERARTHGTYWHTAQARLAPPPAPLALPWLATMEVSSGDEGIWVGLVCFGGWRRRVSESTTISNRPPTAARSDQEKASAATETSTWGGQAARKRPPQE